MKFKSFETVFDLVDSLSTFPMLDSPFVDQQRRFTALGTTNARPAKRSLEHPVELVDDRLQYPIHLPSSASLQFEILPSVRLCVDCGLLGCLGAWDACGWSPLIAD